MKTPNDARCRIEAMIRFLRLQRHARAAVLVTFCGLVSACTFLAPSSPAAAAPSTAPADTAIFSAVVRSVLSSLDRPLYVDPLPIRDGATSWEPRVK